MSKCALCGQRNVDGAIDQFGEFVCVDCFATGEAKFSGRRANILAPVPGYDYSGINYQKTLDAWNKDNNKTKKDYILETNQLLALA